jgi:hypothetical protein
MLTIQRFRNRLNVTPSTPLLGIFGTSNLAFSSRWVVRQRLRPQYFVSERAAQNFRLQTVQASFLAGMALEPFDFFADPVHISHTQRPILRGALHGLTQ